MWPGSIFLSESDQSNSGLLTVILVFMVVQLLFLWLQPFYPAYTCSVHPVNYQ